MGLIEKSKASSLQTAWGNLQQDSCGLKCSLWLTQSETWDSWGSLGVTGVPMSHDSGSRQHTLVGSITFVECQV